MAQAGTPDSEWRTRKRLIDPRLRAAGWRVAKYDPAHPFGKGGPVAVEEFPTENGPADYALCADGRVLGVVEAKKVTLGPQNALTQAERYSRGATQSPLQAILAKAFRGELVPTEADLARAESRPYEPASALLARAFSTQTLQAVSARTRQA